jgi:peroxiredoxin
VVGSNGRTESPLLIGKESLLAALGAATGAQPPPAAARFTRSVEGSRITRNGLRAGALAPEFTLPRVDGGELCLRDYFGQRVLLVFSDPGCAPCQALAPKLERIQRGRRDLQVLMVSRGDREVNRAKVEEQGLSFPVVLQRQWEISRAYGIFATPVGYLIGADGVLAFDVAVGEEAILRLADLSVSESNQSERAYEQVV